MKKLLAIFKSIVWPVLFGIGQLIIQFLLFWQFKESSLQKISQIHPHASDKTLQELLQSFLTSKEGSTEFIQYMIDHLWIVILINLFVFIPFFVYKYRTYHIKAKNISAKNIAIIILLAISLGLSLNIVISFIDHSSRYEVGIIQWILLLSIGIVGPILEELIFRGLAYEELKKSFSKKRAIILLTVLFAVFHTTLPQILYALCMGILFIFLLEKYQSLYASITAHIASNLAVGLCISLLMTCTLPLKLVFLMIFLTIFFSVLHEERKKT